jgi:hypothetical protein
MDDFIKPNQLYLSLTLPKYGAFDLLGWQVCTLHQARTPIIILHGWAASNFQGVIDHFLNKDIKL